MKLVVLVDNNTYIDKYYLGEPALAFYLEDGEQKILFDTGYSDIVIQNAEALRIDLRNVNKIILSHGHNDHTRGLQFLEKYLDFSKVEVVAHPLCFAKKVYEQLDIGAPFTVQEMQQKTKLLLTKEVVQISENFYFLGEVERTNNFENNLSIGETYADGKWEKDVLSDDSALVYKCEDGLFIITGCSHSGICNIVAYAQKIFNEEKVLGIIGGLHLLQQDERSAKTIEFLQNLNLQVIYPCHCVSLKVKADMCRVLPVIEVGVGLEINL